MTYPRPCETTGGCTRGAEEAAGPGTAPARRRTKTFRGRVPLSLSLPLRTTKKPMGKSERVARGPRRARAEPSRGRGGCVHVEREKYHQSERAEREEVRAGACPLAGTLPCRPHPTALPLPARLRPPIRLATPPAGSRCPCPPHRRPSLTSPRPPPFPSSGSSSQQHSTASRPARRRPPAQRSPEPQSERDRGKETHSQPGKRRTAQHIKREAASSGRAEREREAYMAMPFASLSPAADHRPSSLLPFCRAAPLYA